jgi:hypothetical protein
MLEVIIGIILSFTSSVGQVMLKEPIEDYCRRVFAREKIQPNLVLLKSVHLIGTVTDTVGGPIMNSPVELRRYVSQSKQVSLRKVPTDAYGRFDLGTVMPGKYRLLTFPTRAFRQPSNLECPVGESTCNLKIAIQVNATDLPDSVCPIQ